MITLVIDLSSMPEGTAACYIEWRKKGAVAQPPLLKCTDDELDRLISRVDVVGIDAPFGWPITAGGSLRHHTSQWHEVSTVTR